MDKVWIWLFNYHIDHGGYEQGALINDKWTITKKVKGNLLSRLICKYRLCERGDRILFPRNDHPKNKDGTCKGPTIGGGEKWEK